MYLILDSLLSFLLLYKYVSLFLVSFLAALVLPIPSGGILAASGAFAAQGYFAIKTVLLIALLGNVLGDAVGYFLARFYGMELVKKIGFKKHVDSPLSVKFSSYMKEFSYSLIFCSRFLPGAGPLVNILAGLLGVKYRVFFSVGILGQITYVLLYGLVGYFLGSAWENNMAFLSEATLVIIALGATIFLIQYGVFKKIKKAPETI